MSPFSSLLGPEECPRLQAVSVPLHLTAVLTTPSLHPLHTHTPIWVEVGVEQLLQPSLRPKTQPGSAVALLLGSSPVSVLKASDLVLLSLGCLSVNHFVANT